MHCGDVHLGHKVLQRLVVGRRAGGSQNPMAAKQSQALFSGGQHDGHSSPSVHFGSFPGSQKPSFAKHAHVLSGVCVIFCPGQQASHLQSGDVQCGQSLLRDRDARASIRAAARRASAMRHHARGVSSARGAGRTCRSSVSAAPGLGARRFLLPRTYPREPRSRGGRSSALRRTGEP